MIAVAVVLGLGVLAAGIAAAAAARLLPTLRLQLAALALVAVCLPLGVVLASGLVMFGMHAEAKVIAVAVASGLSALIGALLTGAGSSVHSSGCGRPRGGWPPAS
jgi:hypothetical protein